jgi:hypothetical protein
MEATLLNSNRAAAKRPGKLPAIDVGDGQPLSSLSVGMVFDWLVS